MLVRNFIREVLEEERRKYSFGGSQPDENYESEHTLNKYVLIFCPSIVKLDKNIQTND